MGQLCHRHKEDITENHLHRTVHVQEVGHGRGVCEEGGGAAGKQEKWNPGDEAKVMMWTDFGGIHRRIGEREETVLVSWIDKVGGDSVIFG